MQACGSFAVPRRGVFHVKTVLHGRRSARQLGISGEDEDACLKVGYSMKKQDAAHEPDEYVNGTDVETHGYAVAQNTFLQ